MILSLIVFRPPRSKFSTVNSKSSVQSDPHKGDVKAAEETSFLWI